MPGNARKVANSFEVIAGNGAENGAQNDGSFVVNSLFWQPEAIFDAAAEGDAALLQKVSFLVMLVAL